MCPTRHFVYIFFNPVFQVSTAKNEINLFNNHILIVAPVTFVPAGAMTSSAEFLFQSQSIDIFFIVPRLFEEKWRDTVFGFPWSVVRGAWCVVPSF